MRDPKYRPLRLIEGRLVPATETRLFELGMRLRSGEIDSGRPREAYGDSKEPYLWGVDQHGDAVYTMLHPKRRPFGS